MVDSPNQPLVPQTTPSQPLQSQFLPLSTPKPSRKWLWVVVFLVFVTGLSVGGLVILKLQQIKTPNQGQTADLTPTPTAVIAELKTQRWLNLTDARQVLEEGDKLYVVVRGGVVILNKTTGEILDQLSMADGLKNYVSTSLVKKGQTLYIGTQDGFTVFDLATRQVKNISVQQGLVNGANTLLKLDGDDLWVGTFRGISVYNTKTGVIKNYTTEMENGIPAFNAAHLVVTSQAIYAMNVAGGNANTLVSRFDKATKQWTNYNGTHFVYSAPFPGLLDIVSAGNGVWVTDQKDFWHMADTKDARWEKEPILTEKIQQLQIPVNIMRLVGGDSGAVYLWGNNILWEYSLTTHELNSLYPARLYTEGASTLTSGYPIGEVTGRKLWFSLSKGPEFLAYYDFDSKDVKVINAPGRPLFFERLLASIDRQPVVVANGGEVWQLKLDGSFKRLLKGPTDYAHGLSSVQAFQPMEGTSKILVYSQVCGQGCEPPTMVIYDYVEQTIKNIDFDPQVLTAIGTDTKAGFIGELQFEGYKDGVAHFKAWYSNDQLEGFFDTKAMQWRVVKPTAKVDVPMTNVYTCNMSYTFAPANKFTATPCTVGENDKYTWQAVFRDGANYIYQTNKQTKQKEALLPPLTEVEYSPFNMDASHYGISQVTVIGSELWVGTDRGLGIYEPEQKAWRSISAKDGVLSNHIGNFVVDGNYLWSVEGGTGLSGILMK